VLTWSSRVTRNDVDVKMGNSVAEHEGIDVLGPFAFLEDSG
jgi:hypothetical protein